MLTYCSFTTRRFFQISVHFRILVENVYCIAEFVLVKWQNVINIV